MTLLRSQVITALEERTAYRSGFDFQSLAVILAQRRWPQLIASEWNSDYGLDAYGPGELFPDGDGRGLACSNTATLAKIKGDLTKAKDRFPELKVLLFATPQQVHKPQEIEWHEAIWNEFGVKLTVIPREDLIGDLLKPENIGLCETHLGIQLPAREASEEELVVAVRAANREISSKWSNHMKRIPLIDLGLQRTGEGYAEQISTRSQLCEAMRTGLRFMAVAPAGAGKTTLLTQLAEEAHLAGGLCFLVDLPLWIRQDESIFDFISKAPEFRARTIDASRLAALEHRTHFTFLLNGWNEVDISESATASIRLRELDRHHPGAGIMIATREHPVQPPLTRVERIKLRPVTRKQRLEYLHARFGANGEILADTLDKSSVLDELTRTPLILSYVGSLFDKGQAIPETKTGILQAVVELFEQETQHSSALSSPPLGGFARFYLEDIACELTSRGATQLSSAQARRTIHDSSVKLQQASQIVTLPEPSQVLRELMAHHILETTCHPDETFSFLHQQFQELFAAQRLLRTLQEGYSDEMSLRSFIATYINDPAWTEPLLMMAEMLGRRTGANNEACADALIRGALEVDALFAAELSYSCGAKLWERVGRPVASRLRQMYWSHNQTCKSIGLRGMLATGQHEFADVLIPLFTSPDRHGRLASYDHSGGFHLSSLGPSWQEIVSAWSDDARVDFYSTFMHSRRPPEEVTKAAMADPSPSVQRVGVSTLSWNGTERDLEGLLRTLPEDHFEQLVDDLPASYIPTPAHPRVMELLLRQFRNHQLPLRTRVRAFEKAEAIEPTNVLPEVRTLLDGAIAEELKSVDPERLRVLVERLAEDEPAWAKRWLKEKVWSHSLSAGRWKEMIGEILRSDLTDQVERVCTKPSANIYQDHDAHLLKTFGGHEVAAELFRRLLQLDSIVRGNWHDLGLKTEVELHRQIEGVLRGMNPDALVCGILEAAKTLDETLGLQFICDLCYTTGPRASDDRAARSEESAKALYAYLVDSRATLLAAEDYDGSLKGHFNLLLGEVGSAKDLPILEDVARADAERVRRGRLARATAPRSKEAQSSSMSWAVWHVTSIIRLAPAAAWDVLLQWLRVPEYEEHAIWGLFQLSLNERIPPGIRSRHYKSRPKDAALFRNKNPEHPFREPQRQELTELFRSRDRELREGDVASASGRADQRKWLAVLLAQLDPVRSSGLVFDAFVDAPKQKWLYDGYQRVDALEALLLGGVTLSYELTERVLEPVFAHFQKEIWNDQEHDRAARAFSLLLFTDAPERGLATIQTGFLQQRVNLSALRTFIARAGHSGFAPVLQVLTQAIATTPAHDQLQASLLDAAMLLDPSASHQTLIGLLTQPQKKVDWGHPNRAVAHLSKMYREDSTFRDEILKLDSTKLSADSLSLLVQALLQTGMEESLLLCLGAFGIQGIDGHTMYRLRQRFEEMFVHHIPITGMSNSYNLSPRAVNNIRKRIVEMASKPEPSQAGAKWLLEMIEIWRLERGRPNGESRNPLFPSSDVWPPFC
jgi:hypothetical protein